MIGSDRSSQQCLQRPWLVALVRAVVSPEHQVLGPLGSSACGARRYWMVSRGLALLPDVTRQFVIFNSGRVWAPSHQQQDGISIVYPLRVISVP